MCCNTCSNEKLVRQLLKQLHNGCARGLLTVLYTGAFSNNKFATIGIGPTKQLWCNNVLQDLTHATVVLWNGFRLSRVGINCNFCFAECRTRSSFELCCNGKAHQRLPGAMCCGTEVYNMRKHERCVRGKVIKPKASGWLEK